MSNAEPNSGVHAMIRQLMKERDELSATIDYLIRRYGMPIEGLPVEEEPQDQEIKPAPIKKRTGRPKKGTSEVESQEAEQATEKRAIRKSGRKKKENKEAKGERCMSYKYSNTRTYGSKPSKLWPKAQIDFWPKSLTDLNRQNQNKGLRA